MRNIKPQSLNSGLRPRILLFAAVFVHFVTFMDTVFGFCDQVGRRESEHMSKSKFDRYTARLASLKAQNDLSGIAHLSHDVAAQRRDRADSRVARLALGIVGAFTSRNLAAPNEAIGCLSAAVRDPANLPIDLHLAIIVRLDAATTVSDAEGRKHRAELWLIGWKRLNDAVSGFRAVAEAPALNVLPPVETGLPPGVSPDAIKDAELRAEYERRIEENATKAADGRQRGALMRLGAKFPMRVEQALARLYSRAPESTDELKRIMAEYGIDRAVIERVLRATYPGNRQGTVDRDPGEN